MWVGILAILAISIVLFLSRRRKSSRIKAYHVLLKELEGLEKVDNASVGTRSSSIIKRALQLYFPEKDFLALSASEIEMFLQEDNAKDQTTEIRELAKLLTKLEHSRFSGNTATGIESIPVITRLIRTITASLQREEKRGKRPSPDKLP